MSDERSQIADSGAEEGGLLATVAEHAPDGWRAKLARVAVQLVAGTEVGATFYGKVRERLDTIEGRSTVSKALARTVADQAVRDAEVVERAQARFLGSAIQKQVNLEAVITGAGDHLPMLPAPASNEESQSPVEGKAGTGIDGAVAPETDAPLDADWASTFTSIAENASTDELRRRLSRVLAGELQAPGRYSRATLRVIAELDRTDLQAMERVLPYILGDVLVRTNHPEPLPTIDALLPLVDAGMIMDANPQVVKNWGPATEEGANYLVGGTDWGLLVTLKLNNKVELPVVPLTRNGVAVADLLGRPDERIILRRIFRQLPTHIYSAVLLGKRMGEKGFIPPIEHLFPGATVINDSTVGGPSPFDPVTVDFRGKQSG